MVLRRLPRLDLGAADVGFCIYGVNAGFLLYSLAIDLVAVLVVCNDTFIVMAYGLRRTRPSCLSSINASSAKSMEKGILTIEDAR